MMDLRETLSVSIDALRANKLRAALTSLGVIIGSASIVLVVTVALTSRKFVISKIEAVGSNLVWAELIRTSEKAQPLSYELTLDDMQAVKETIPGVAQVAGTTDMQMSVVAEGVVRPVTLIGVTEGYREIRRLIVVRGRLFRFLGHGIPKQDVRDHTAACEAAFRTRQPGGTRSARGRVDLHDHRGIQRASGNLRAFRHSDGNRVDTVWTDQVLRGRRIR